MTCLTRLSESYVQSVNTHNPAAFHRLFAENALVDDNGRQFRGLKAIREWSEREIFAAQVTLEILRAAEHDGESVVTTKVDGNFDRTGLPDPVVIDHHIRSQDGVIASLTCRLAKQPAP